MVFAQVRVDAAVFLTASLEYLVAEVLELAGNCTRYVLFGLVELNRIFIIQTLPTNCLLSRTFLGCFLCRYMKKKRITPRHIQVKHERVPQMKIVNMLSRILSLFVIITPQVNTQMTFLHDAELGELTKGVIVPEGGVKPNILKVSGVKAGIRKDAPVCCT